MEVGRENYPSSIGAVWGPFRAKKTLKGSFSSYEGDGSENSHIKTSSRFFCLFFKVCREYLNSFKMSNVGKFPRKY